MIPHGSLAFWSTAGTCCRAPIRLLAVLVWMTRLDEDAAAGWYLPALLVVPCTRGGATRTPPLAMVEYTLAIWIALASTPWPNDSVNRSLPHQADGEGRMPLVSPGRSSPLSDPSPNARK